MLEDIREKSQGMTAKIVLGLIILTFAVAGVGSYSNSVDTSVAEVNGEKISLQTFNKSYQSQLGRMKQQFGQMFDTLSADQNYMANFRQSVLDNLINETLINQNTHELAIRVSDTRLKDAMRAMPEFQVDGVFDNNRYLAIINQAGFFQPSAFRDYLRVEITRRQLSQSLIASEFNLPYQEKIQLALQNQTRDIRFANIAVQQFKTDVIVSEAEIKDYYLANQLRFENKEQVKIDYITVDVADIAKTIEVTDEDITKYYQENLASFSQAEQRKISHILIEFADDETAAKVVAEAVLVRLNNGEDFAVVAKEVSQDTFSGENGGDLDWLERGSMEDSFDVAAFALTDVDTITEVIKTTFGYHIIKLTALKPAIVQSLAEVSAELKMKVSEDKALDKFFELQQEMGRISYEYPDSLDDAAEAVNATVQSSIWLNKTNNAAPFDQAKVIESAFSSLILEENLNSDVIEVSDTLAMVMRLNTYQEAKVKPLSEVQAQIETLLIADKATAKAKSTVDELLAKFKSGESITGPLAALNTSFTVKENITRYGQDLDQSISRKAFTLAHPVEGNVSAATVALSNGDISLVELQAVNAQESIADVNLAKQQTSQLAQAVYQSYVDSLKVDAKITRKAVSQQINNY